MNKPLISVIVPIYKVEDYLDKCIISIVNQTYSNLEIILVDDGSPDNCPQMCNEWEKKDQRVKVIHKQNGGLSSARNKGLEVCTGEYIGFVDSDDYIAPNMYEKLYNTFQTYDNIGVVACMIQGVHNDTLIPFNTHWHTTHTRIVESCNFATGMQSQLYAHTAWNKLYKRDVALSAKFREGLNNEDMLYMFDIRTCIKNNNYNYVEIPDFLYFYLKRDGSICNSAKTPLALHKINNIIMMYDECKQEEQTLKDILYKEYYNALYGFIDLLNNNKELSSKYQSEYRQKFKDFPISFIIKKMGHSALINYVIMLYFPQLRIILKKIIK